MAASAAVDVVGTSPISFTDSTGAQRSVPLSALTFSGSKPDIADDWAPEFKLQSGGQDNGACGRYRPDRCRRADTTSYPAADSGDRRDGCATGPRVQQHRGCSHCHGSRP